jgi:hypothetical protein
MRFAVVREPANVGAGGNGDSDVKVVGENVRFGTIAIYLQMRGHFPLFVA